MIPNAPQARRPAVPTSETPPAVPQRLTYISVVHGQRRVVYSRRLDVPPGGASEDALVFGYEEVHEGRSRPLSVLTPEGVCQTTMGRSFRASQSCGRQRGEWIGFELNDCAFPEAGPLVVFQGHDPLRVRSLLELPAASGPEARAFEARAMERAQSGFVPSSVHMQREMEAMQTQEANPAAPSLPPIPPAQLGTVRTMFDIWMVDVLNGLGVPLMATVSSPVSEFRVHPGNQWNTLVAGPRNTDYAFLIGAHGIGAHGTDERAWPIVVPVRRGTWPPPSPIGFIGPANCPDL